jgi:hypothetical protein
MQRKETLTERTEREYTEMMSNPAVQTAIQNQKERDARNPELIAIKERLKDMMPMQKLDTYCDIIIDGIEHYEENGYPYLTLSRIISDFETFIINKFCSSVDIDIGQCRVITGKDGAFDAYIAELQNIKKKIAGKTPADDNRFAHDLFGIFMSGSIIGEIIYEKRMGI